MNIEGFIQFLSIILIIRNLEYWLVKLYIPIPIKENK